MVKYFWMVIKMNDCIFCKIVNGEIPSMKVYEDDIILAYLDINPDSNGHTLIVPKKHYTDIYDIDDETLAYIYKSARKVMNILAEKLGCDGFSLLQNNGIVQEVKHYHLHIKPVYKEYKTVELKKISENIKNPKEIFDKIKNS